MRAPITLAIGASAAVILGVSCAVTDAGEAPANADVAAAPLEATPRLSIPSVASQPIELRAASGMRLGVSWVGAAPVQAVRDEGASPARGARSSRANYPGALGGADVELAWSADAFEDSVRFASRPGEAVVRYALDLEGVAGLRLVDDVLELLDEGGAPRLRMGRAHVDDAHGLRVRAQTTIEDCAYSADPRAPWGEPVVAPGRSRCTVAVRWDDAAVAYPATLDPIWSDTGNLNEGRADRLDRLRPVLIEGGPHAGKVFVAGGANTVLNLVDATPLLDSSEVFDPTSGTWATVAPLPMKLRGSIQAYVVAPTGPGVLVAGGCGFPCDAQPMSWIYDLATGAYLPVGALGSPRAAAFVMTMADGRILVTGGGGKSGQPIPVTTEIFDPSTGMWAFAASRAKGRIWGGSTVLKDGRFLIAGGRDFLAPGTLSTAEIYDPVADTWANIGDLKIDRFFFDFVTLDDGRVIGVGGETQHAYLSEVEMLDPSDPDLHFDLTGELDAGVLGHVTVKLSNGFVAAVSSYASDMVQLFDPKKNQWALGTPLPELWWDMGATTLLDGRVLLVGGVLDNGEWPDASTKTMILAPVDDGVACVTDGECASTHCVDGVCCDTACDSACSACTTGKKGGGENGVCGAAITGTADARCGDDSHTCGATGVCAEGGVCALVSAGETCQGCPVNQAGSCDGDGLCVCTGAHCVDDHTLETTNGPTIDCGPYLCAEDDCRHSCNTSTECAEGWLCDATHQCVFAGTPAAPPPPTPAPPAAGCCSTAPASPSEHLASLLAAAAALGLTAERRRRRATRGRGSSAS